MSKVVTRTIRISPELDDAMRNTPMKKSGIVQAAIVNAFDRPDVLGKALNARRLDIHQYETVSDMRVGVSLTDELLVCLDHLAKMTRLPTEEVIRLSIEAYLKRL